MTKAEAAAILEHERKMKQVKELAKSMTNVAKFSYLSDYQHGYRDGYRDASKRICVAMEE